MGISSPAHSNNNYLAVIKKSKINSVLDLIDNCNDNIYPIRYTAAPVNEVWFSLLVL